MRLFGYARVSTSQESLEVQIKAFEEAGVRPHRIFIDKNSSRHTKREWFDSLRLKVNEGDIILIKRIDLLWEDTANMIHLIKEFNCEGVAIRFLDNGIITESRIGKIVAHFLSVERGIRAVMEE